METETEMLAGELRASRESYKRLADAASIVLELAEGDLENPDTRLKGEDAVLFARAKAIIHDAVSRHSPEADPIQPSGK